jgi:hypothetical protein
MEKHILMLRKGKVVTKVENFDSKCLTLSKENQKSPFKHFRFGRSKFPVKELKKSIKEPKLGVEATRRICHGILKNNRTQVEFKKQ